MSNEHQPYLSFVVTTRNDDHGGNLHERTQIFINGLLEQCKRHELPAELIVVEWNPPDDRPRLKDAFEWPVEGSPCQVRIIEVPPEIHHRLDHADRLPLFQMIAKNVGIRRSRAPFSLATNIDILFSDELMAFLKSRRLQPNLLYRINRYDVPAEVPVDAPMDEQLSWCKNNLLRVNSRNGSYNVQTKKYSIVYGKEFYENYLLDLKPVRVPLFTNACGDFTLLSKEGWDKTKGYCERPIWSFHIDSIFIYSAFHAGFREVELPDPMRIYHIEHHSGFTPESKDKMYSFLEEKKIDKFTNDDLTNFGVQMRQNNQPVIWNGPDWGMANESLPEEALN